jgi:hypothetical protein
MKCFYLGGWGRPLQLGILWREKFENRNVSEFYFLPLQTQIIFVCIYRAASHFWPTPNESKYLDSKQSWLTFDAQYYCCF